jgi:choline dehydrogenase-like flavoprotein
MATSPNPQKTDFTLDVLGRFVCNGLDEALRSIDKSQRPDARPFDVIVAGGGSFGGVLAQHLFSGDKTRSRRILVLDGGPFLLPEHVQNLPMMGITAPGPIEQDPGVLREQVWGLPWQSKVKTGFPGLAYCVGGRSVFWGGWSPQLLDTATDTEMPRDKWPTAVVDDLNNRYFREAAEQIGTTQTNDFIHGLLHRAMRRQLFDGINNGKVTEAIPLGELPLHLDNVAVNRRELFKLEAPLAVQAKEPRSGFFAFNKFSSVPILTQVARAAWVESQQGLGGGVPGDDVKKRLMIVPNCRVIRLITDIAGGKARVTGVLTNQGFVPLPAHGVAVLALGMIENARVALLSFGGISNYHLIGTNFLAHLRSNLTVLIPTKALKRLDEDVKDLEQSALFVKGRHVFGDTTKGYFHQQITGSAGGGGLGIESDAELFKKVPDIDLLKFYRAADKDHAAITIRSIGETQSNNPSNRITLALDQIDEVGVPRAFVQIGDPREPEAATDSPQTKKDRELWAAMDKNAEEIAKVFAVSEPYEVIFKNRDGMGTTHHEAGGLWMGDDPTKSVTNGDGRFHFADNAYVAGPSLFPTVGSPNPMLTGTALARRTADKLLESMPHPVAPPAEAGFEYLFDGTDKTFSQWQKADGKGTFSLIDGQIVAYPRGGEFALLYYAPEAFNNFVLRLQFRLNDISWNSGVFVRFRDPRTPPDSIKNDPRVVGNKAWVAVLTGFEAQIDELAVPNNLDKARTGAIYDIEIGTNPGQQQYSRGPVIQAGQWNDYEIEVSGNTYTVRLGGQQTTVFTNTDPNRGKPASQDPLSGYVGVQAHTGLVAFRHIRIKRL